MKNTDYIERCFKHAVKAEDLLYEIEAHFAMTEIDEKAYKKVDELLRIIWNYAEKVGNEIENAPF